mgnify:CR=1 FL=1
MTLNNSKGYALIATSLLLPLVLISLGLVTFSLLKTRHIHKMKTVCQTEYHFYFSGLKNEMNTIQMFGAAATALYQAQMILLPMIWLPPIAKAYRTLLDLREKMERLQNRIIDVFNTMNRLRSVQTFGSIQRSLYSENKKIKSVLTHQSLASYKVDPKLQLTKRMNIIFPPYDPHPKIETRQRFAISIKSSIQPKSWIQTLAIDRLSEDFSCSATLVKTSENDLIISYDL